MSKHLTSANIISLQYSRLMFVSIYTYHPEGSCLPSWCHDRLSISI